MNRFFRPKLVLTLAAFLMIAAVVLLRQLLPVAAHAKGAGLYHQTNLVSDLPNIAKFQDPNLLNPWGLSHGPTTPWWVSDNGAGVSTLYNGAGTAIPLVVTIPPPAGSPAGTTAAPTGNVFNGTSGFVVATSSGAGPSFFMFATEDGTISGWNPSADPTHAILAVDRSTVGAGAVYKGLAIGSNASGTFIYALQDAAHHDDASGPAHGFVDIFDTNGNLIRRLVSHGRLNSPWGLALAPADFGLFSNALLVGNFGNGRINAFDLKTGEFLGQLRDQANNPITIDDLWGLAFGNDASAGKHNELFFTAGINDEADGLFGKITSVS